MPKKQQKQKRAQSGGRGSQQGGLEAGGRRQEPAGPSLAQGRMVN